jgi:hypothetical protein
MMFFIVQNGAKEAERRAVRSLRRSDCGNEVVAVALELEEVRPTACDHHRRRSGTLREG